MSTKTIKPLTGWAVMSALSGTAEATAAETPLAHTLGPVPTSSAGGQHDPLSFCVVSVGEELSGPQPQGTLRWTS